MDVQQNIRDGVYDTKLTYPSLHEQQAAKSQEEIRELRKAYRSDQYRLQDVFKGDLEIEFDVVGDKRAQLLFEIAWSHGHSAGYSEVYNYYTEFVELIK